MKLIIFYLLTTLIGLAAFIASNLLGLLPDKLEALRIGLMCAAIGGVGGCVYCLRGVYINACVRKQWDDEWKPWYFIRPIVSIVCGGVSYLFLRAGLLILESSAHPDSSELGFYALAFIAGLNVDKFIGKIEDIAQVAWGIEKTRASKPKENNEDKE